MAELWQKALKIVLLLACLSYLDFVVLSSSWALGSPKYSKTGNSVRKTLSNMKAVAVLERDSSIGAGGIIYTELARSLFGNNGVPHLINYILGLGGRDVTFGDIKNIGLALFQERQFFMGSIVT